MIDLVPIVVGGGAPAGCVRCRRPDEPAYLAVPAIASSLEGALGAPGVALTGPEPFDHPELPAVVAACRAAGFARIALETDGAALSAHGNAAGVLAAGVRHLWVRVLGADDATHDARLGSPGRGAAAVLGVQSYREAARLSGVPVVITAVVPVCAHVLPDLPAIVAACGSRGLDAVRLVSAGALPRGADAIVAAACDTGMVNRVWVATDGALPLPASHRLHGTPDGTLAVASAGDAS